MKKLPGIFIILLMILCCVITGVAYHYKTEAATYKKSAINNHKYYSSQELDAKNTIEQAFYTLFEYDNSNFLSRFDDAKQYMNSSVIAQQQGAGKLEIPQIKVERKVNSLKVYRELNEDNCITALVQMDSTYSVDGTANPSVNELYRVRLNLKTHKIDKFESLGDLNIVKNS